MAALLSLTAFQLTFRVAEPEGLARRLPLLANGVTDQGLGGRSAATGAGTPGVSCSGHSQPHLHPIAYLDQGGINEG